MFNDVSIATTALSSFNNAALVGPYFLVTGFLTIPLFIMVYIYGRDFVSKFGWNKNLESYTGFWSSLVLLLWLMLFGGNYAVMRDSISLLPILVAFVLFLLMVIVTQKSIQLKYLDKIHSARARWFIFISLLVIAAFSGSLNLWGILLPVSAILCGIIVGARSKANISLMPITTLIFGVVLGLILMQPEYFRFGQLGNLTFMHLLGLMVTGFFGVTALVTRYVKAKDRIHQSAYIKLKWLFRIVSLLALVLFISTESVPVFVGLLGAIGLSEMLTVFHLSEMSEDLCKQSWGMFLLFFGIIIICPVISAMGIVYLSSVETSFKLNNFLKLL